MKEHLQTQLWSVTSKLHLNSESVLL